MSKIVNIGSIASAALVASAVSASAAFIDFTDNSTGLSGALSGGITWEVTASHPAGLNSSESGPGATGPLAGENDGLGIGNDEITFPGQWITVTFSEEVKLFSAHFLDTFIAAMDDSIFQTVRDEYYADYESALMSMTGPLGVIVAQADAQEVTPGVGYTAFEGVYKGTAFTFMSGKGNDNVGQPDIALAAIEVAAVPLPAGMLLLGTALGGLGLARRRKTS